MCYPAAWDVSFTWCLPSCPQTFLRRFFFQGKTVLFFLRQWELDIMVWASLNFGWKRPDYNPWTAWKMLDKISPEIGTKRVHFFKCSSICTIYTTPFPGCLSKARVWNPHHARRHRQIYAATPCFFRIWHHSLTFHCLIPVYLIQRWDAQQSHFFSTKKEANFQILPV